MTLMIGKIIWVDRKQGLLQNLQGETIPFELNKAGPVNRRLNTGKMYIFDVYVLDTQEGKRKEAINLRGLEGAAREENLIECFMKADPRLVNEVLEYMAAPYLDGELRKLFTLHKKDEQLQRIQETINKPSRNYEQDYRDFAAVVYQSLRRPDLQVYYSPELVQSYIDPCDEELAKRWLPKNTIHQDKRLAQMLSARIAEKVAQNFYRKSRHDVKDIAITQVDGSSEEWRKCDILLDNNISIDVKNARNPVKNKIRYIEYCVPEYKYDRRGDEIVIAGVFSPYLRLNQIRGIESISGNVKDIYFLGETTNSVVRALQTSFSGLKFHVDIQTHRHLGNRDIIILPPWVFDYPDDYYREQNSGRSKLREFGYDKYPLPQLWMNGFNPLPALIACKLAIPEEWSMLNNEQLSFIEKLKRHDQNRIKLPVLYLSILTHFLEKVTSDASSLSYSPNIYFPLLYRPGNFTNPIGIFDPLNLIEDLIRTLQLVWDNRSQVPWETIDTYRFTGLGLLVGKKHNGEPITILAYCGGTIPGKGKCGHSPLVVGKNKTCPNGKLVCEICSFCCEKCWGNRTENEDQIWEET